MLAADKPWRFEFYHKLRMDRSVIPKGLRMTADFVVEESLRGFDRSKLLVIPGWRCRLIGVQRWTSIPATRLRRSKA